MNIYDINIIQPRSIYHHDTRPLKTSLVTLPPLQTEPRRGPHRQLAPLVLKQFVYSHTNSYNFAMTLITQDDHLTAGAWAACNGK